MELNNYKVGPHPDIGTAWLILSHGAFVGATIASTGLSVAFLTFAYGQTRRLGREFQQLALGWNIVSLVISAWTVYAIFKTWASAEEWPVKARIFDDFGFGFLLLVELTVTFFNLWTLRMALLWYCLGPDNKNSKNNNNNAITDTAAIDGAILAT